jgi:hypothetical protein
VASSHREESGELLWDLTAVEEHVPFLTQHLLPEVRRCELTASKAVLKAPMISGLCRLTVSRPVLKAPMDMVAMVSGRCKLTISNPC